MEEQRSAKFPAFPYKPYPIQLDFMNALYDSLNNGGIAMLESPTGTGKTLSIICSALQWLLDTKQQQNSAISNQNRTLGNQSCSDDEPDWMRDFTAKTDDDAPKKEAKEKKKHGIRLKRLQKHRNVDDVREIFDGYNTEGSNMKGKIGEEDVDDGEFLVEDYESEEEGSGSMQSKRKVANSSSDDDNDEEEGGSDEEEEETGLKIYFCSRTHSQLSQFVKELRKTVFARELKVVCLGSRKNFCINEEVLKLGNSTCINERCLELQKNKKNKVTKMKTLVAGGRIRTKASSGCPMLRKQKQQKQFRIEMSESEPLDIEDLVHLGNKLGTCPYYGSRSMTPAADLVILPYQSLLSKTARESLGLNLKNNIVIIDEAHNLADSLISMYDSKITLSQLERVHSHLDKYFQRFRNLLGAGNRRYIQTLLVLTRAFIQTLLHEEEDTTPIVSDSSVAINEFLFSLNIDNINLVKLLHYIKESNIIHKVSGYGEKAAKLQKISTLKDSIEGIEEGSTLSGFQALVNMLLSLTNNDADGRIILSRARPTTFEQRGGYLKYIMLTGEKIFSEITSQAHAVILAGGTLQPIEETRERLFPWLPMDQMQFFSCGHVIPPENILPIAVSNGPSGHSFDFSYNSRSSSSMIEELGLLLCNLSTVVPQGVIVFFSSFDYESHVHDSWKSLGLLQRITKKKRVFREPRRSTEVETVLNQYKETIESISKGDSSPYNGAILLAVVGGKISEGINFSDGMGRCIVMVGLPYPSPSDIELMERVKYIEGLGNSNNTKFPVNNECRDIDFQTGFDVLRSCKNRGREYYENLCMKAVNQSIGRAIRHVNDYAAILLVDARYASDPSKRSFSHPTSKLPQWIKGRLVSKTGKKEEDYQTTNSRERENHHPRWKKIILSRARRSEREREMLLEETSQMTRKIFLRTFQTLRSYFFGRWFHKNLPKAPPYNPFFCPTQNSNNNNPNTIQELDDFYRQFSELWDTQKKKKRKKKKNAISIEESITTSFIKFENQSYETNAQELVKEEKEIANFHEEEKGKDDDEERGEIEKGHELAVKLKKVVMEDENEGDADDALDIEEVLHCYSQITCPAYLGAVDKLLLDVHSEFLIPQPQPSPSVGVNNSTPRVGPLKL